MSRFAPLFRRVAHHAATRPGALALAFGKSRLAYGALLRRIAGSTEVLRRKGVVQGDHILLCMGNSPEFVIAYFAIHAAGGVVCPLPPDSPVDVIADLKERTRPRLLLSDREEFAQSDLPLSFTEEEAELLPEVVVDADHAADILFTSGTTGRRKGVVLSHGNIAAAAENIAAFIGNDGEDHEAVPLPLAHSFGLGRLRSMAHVGNSILLAKGLADAPGLFRQMASQKASGLAIVPAGVEILQRTLGDHLGLLQQNLEYIELGSAPIRPNTRDWLVRTLPQTRICHHYGLTEASRAAFLDFADKAAPPSAVGKPSPGVSIRIVDEAGNMLPVGEAGEVVVRGEVVARSYFDDPVLTQARMTADGFRTGDGGFIDADGYVHLTGRLDDVINVGGKKVAPGEVEATLLGLEGVADIACVGEPDPAGVLGEVVVAHVVLDGQVGEEDLARHASLHLEAHKRPARYTFVDTLPRTTSGKLQRYLLRRR